MATPTDTTTMTREEQLDEHYGPDEGDRPVAFVDEFRGHTIAIDGGASMDPREARSLASELLESADEAEASALRTVERALREGNEVEPWWATFEGEAEAP
jgi:hypothetical protein